MGIVSRNDLLKPARTVHEEEERRERWSGSRASDLLTSEAKQ